MKLDLLLLRDAAAREDTETIIRIFIDHFPQLEARRNRSWRFKYTIVIPDDQIAVWMPDAVYVCKGGCFERVPDMYDIFGEHIIMLSERFPCYL